MLYEFKDFYLLNKKDIEGGTNFDRETFYSRVQAQLVSDGFFPERDFHLKDKRVIEGLCLYEEDEFWVVAYFERGVGFSPAFFVNSRDAEMFFYAKLRSFQGPVH